MSDGARRLDGRRVLLAGKAVAIIGILRDVVALGALAEAATRIHDALDFLEDAEPPYAAVLIADELDDADGLSLLRAIRGAPLVIGDVRVVSLGAGRVAQEADVVLRATEPAALVAAILDPIIGGTRLSEAPVLDLGELAAMAGGLTAEIRGMLGRFTGQARDLAKEAAVAAGNRDGAAAERCAHTLKGAALSAGAIRLGRWAAIFERAADDGDWPAAASIDLTREADDLAKAIDTALRA